MNSIEGWAARDKNGHLNFFLGKPHRIKNTRGEEYWVGHGRMKQPNDFLSELSWDDEPIEVELTIKDLTTLHSGWGKAWKPSDEQMNALYDILHPADTVNRLALESLYEQLKAL